MITPTVYVVSAISILKVLILISIIILGSTGRHHRSEEVNSEIANV